MLYECGILWPIEMTTDQLMILLTIFLHATMFLIINSIKSGLLWSKGKRLYFISTGYCIINQNNYYLVTGSVIHSFEVYHSCITCRK